MKIIAHRGFSEAYPENTLLSFKKALETGVDAIEADIRLSRDEQAVIFHDASLVRITDIDKTPESLTLQELQKLDAGRGEIIPSLDELLTLIDGKATLILEIKYNPATYKRLCAVMEASIYDKLTWIEVSCFEDIVLEEMHRLNKDIKLHKLIQEETVLQDQTFQSRYDYVNYFDININLMKTALDKGLIKQHKVILWTVNKEDISTASQEGLYGIMTNNPKRTKEQYA